jgi:alpha-tubulin suppressor-like RCC1 family protein
MSNRTLISAIASITLLVSVYGSPSGTARAQPLAVATSTDGLQFIAQVPNIGSVLDVEARGDYLFAATRDPAPSYALNFRAFNVSDPGNPVQVGVYHGAAGEFSIDGDYAYVGASSLWIVRISDPASLVLTGSAAPSTPLAQDAIHIDNVAYVANLTWGLAIFDTSNLSAPAYLGYRDTYYNRGYALSVAIRGNYLYVGCTRGVQIYDISNRTSPSLVNSFATTQQVDGLSVTGDRLYVSAYGAGLAIFELADPANPIQLATYASPPGGATKGARAIGNRAFVADYAQVSVLDVSNPSDATISPPRAQYSTTLTTGSAVNLDIRGDYVYVAASNGLLVMRYAPPTVRALQIETGDKHSCALTELGGVKCWGDNTSGQLGNGLTVTIGSPVDVVGMTTDIAAISVGYNHSCALSNLGGVKCWGAGWGPIPFSVSGLSSGIAAISAGGRETCALTSSGAVKCFSKSSVTNVDGLSSGVSAISKGGGHLCALMSSGGVKCMGANYSGQLGDGTTVARASPVDVIGLTSGVAAITSGGDDDFGVGHTCALTVGGGVKCWGSTWYGALGNGSSEWGSSSVPVDVIGLTSGVSKISAGGAHTCAVTDAGVAKCWGLNQWGALGDGTQTHSNVPVISNGLSKRVNEISAGGGVWSGGHTCAITDDGGIRCWGYDDAGQLGSGQVGGMGSTIPRAVSSLSSVSAIDAQGGHACALTSEGAGWCWGAIIGGESFEGTWRNVPEVVAGLAGGISAIATGSDFSCALMSTGSVKCWGRNYYGQLGDGTNTTQNIPVNVSGLTSGVTAISAGSNHACARTDVGGLRCWGSNGYGELGDGTTTHRNIPVDVVGLSTGVLTFSLGSTYWGAAHTCALTSAGSLKCWGNNSAGQLGDGTYTDQHTPVDVSGLASGALGVATGSYHTCALTSSNGVMCWGLNDKGQLGDGTTISRSLPVTVSGLMSRTTVIDAGYRHSCAVVGSDLKCWGDNSEGQLGDGTLTQRLIPVPVVGPGNGLVGVALGDRHTCALSTSGSVKCWGDSGALGDGTAWRTTPAIVVGFTQPRTYLPVLTR